MEVKIMFVLGVDIGSSTTKIVAIDMDENILGKCVINLGTGTVGIERAFSELYSNTGLNPADCAFTMATGYGRFMLKDADSQMAELSCHAKGVNKVMPDIRTIIDIGGQDCKAMLVNDKGILQQFAMNDKCAAGTGRFLETMSRVLNIPIAEFGNLDYSSTSAIQISNTCTVFAESEVISSLSQGNKVEDIIAGIHHSVARKVAGLVYRVGMVQSICLTGGVAQNSGIHRALEKELNVSLLIPPDPRITGALGAAILGLEQYRKSGIQKNLTVDSIQ
jgi:predicted CoA-substrate-specific enzyme activase